MRNWILCACIALSAPCLAKAQQPSATDKAPAGTPTKAATAESKLAEIAGSEGESGVGGFQEKG